MKNLLRFNRAMLCPLLFTCVLFFNETKAQTETIRTGSFIVNMGNPNAASYNDDLKPYGMIYDLMKNYSVPVKWVIAPGKSKDGADFIHNGISYKGGTFIIPVEYRSVAVNNRITYWQTQGVVGNNSVSNFTAYVYTTLLSIPRWTLDASHGKIAENYLKDAGITNTGFSSGAYNWKAVSALDYCDDLFAMPHASPNWSSHNRLYSWNRDFLGSIWANCHAISALENSINPANTAEQMNFLTTRTAVVTPTNWPNNSLKLWTAHDNGTPPYIHRLTDDPVAQYIGASDGSHTNGSEQILVPKQSTDPGGATRFRPGAKIIAYDPTQVNIPNPDLANGNVAAAMVYGYAFDDNTRGLVMYETGHVLLNGSAPNAAAVRAFLNFSFLQVQRKAPQLTFTGITNGQEITVGTPVNFSVSPTSPIPGVSFSYQWSASCSGAFGSPTSASTTFTPSAAGPCVITCKVTDNCGRVSFQSFYINVLAFIPPTVIDDVTSLANACTPDASVTINVLTNDVPNISAISFTSLNQATASPAAAGVWSSDSNGNVTFVPVSTFTGSATITYTVTNTNGLTGTATITVNVGTPDANGCFPNSVYAPSQVDFISLDNFISESGTGAVLNGTSLNDDENTYTTAGTDYLNFGSSAANYLIMATGSTSPLRAKDTLNIYWSKQNTSTGTISVQLGQSSTGPWTNTQTFSNSIAASGIAANMISQFLIPTGVSGITHVRISAGTPPATNSSTDVWLDGIEFEYLSCVSKQPVLNTDGVTVLEDAGGTINVLQNDTDPQGLGLTVMRILTQPSNGKVSINTDGTVTYINSPDNANATSFTYEACNSQGYCSTGTVNITIIADGCGSLQYKPNPPSGAVTKIFSYQYTGVNAATANSTVTNFMDSKLNAGGSGTGNYGAISSADVGIITGNNINRGIFQFNISEIPSTAIVQSSSFSLYRSGGGPNTQTISLHGLNESFVENSVTWLQRSTGVNWNPAAGGTFGAVQSSAVVTSTFARYNWDVLNLTQSWISAPVNNFGVLLKTPETLNKAHQFTTKEGLASLRPQLTITYVVPEPCSPIGNRAPLANPDLASTVTGQSVVISPLLNDSDIDAGNTFTITGISGITAGSATFTANAITYTANVTPTVPRTERLTYTITDNNGATDQAYVYIRITNAPPSINSDSVSTNSGTAVSIDVLANDYDPEGGGLTAPVIVITAPAKNGIATVVGNNIQYTPGPGFTGRDTIEYQVCEILQSPCSPQAFCDTALVFITVLNQAPVANNDSKNILPCLANTLNLLSNDTDPEGNSLSISAISALSDPLAGTLVNNNDGTVTFTPASAFSGTVTFTYTIIDNGVTPLISAPATVSITVNNPPNTAPIAANDVEYTNMDEVLYASVLDNDYDPEGQDLTNPVIIVPPLYGTAVVLPNGLIVYTPNLGYAGSDILTYQVCDKVINQATCTTATSLCTTATLSIDVLGSNTIVAVNDEHSTWVNTPVSGPTLLNDYEIGGTPPLIFRGFIIGGTRYTSGSQTVSGTNALGSPVANAGTLAINPAGTYTFSPANNFSGSMIVSYAVNNSDPATGTEIANLQITVSPLPDSTNSVIANNDENSTFGPALNSNVLTNDRDPQGNSFTVNSYRYDSDGDGIHESNGSVGSPVIIGGKTTSGLPAANVGTLTLNSNGTYTFTPVTNFYGAANISYTICDNNATAACATAVLHIEILIDENGADNDRPIAGDDFIYTLFNVAASGSFINNDRDPNGDQLSLNGTTIVPGGPQTLITTALSTNGGTVQFYADGTYTYTPLAGFSGPDDIVYSVCDITAVTPQPLCKSARIHFLVAPDDSPIAVNDTNTTNEDTPVSGNVSTNDTPSNDGGNTWSLVGANGGAANGTVTMNPDGTYTYTPNANYNGTDVFTYQLCDVDGDCSTATVTITINPVDDLPVAVNDTNSTNEDTPVTGNASSNDTPSGDGGNVWSLVGVNGGATNGTVTMSSSGTYTYTPNANYNGTDVFTYQLCDVDGDCSTATVTITINPVDDLPVAVNDTNSTNEDTPVTGNASSNDTPSGDGGNVWSLIGANGGATNGTVTMTPGGSYTYTPNANYNGTDVFTYQLCDVDGDCSIATVTITILSIADTVFAVNDENSTWQYRNVSGNVLTNDFNIVSDNQTFNSFLDPVTSGVISSGAVVSGRNKSGNFIANAGSISFDASGNYTFSPAGTFAGIVTLPYRVCGSGAAPLCDTAFLAITVDILPTTANSVIANNDENLTFGTQVSNTLFANDRDPQYHSFAVTLIEGGSPGTTFTVPGVDHSGNTVANAGTLLVNTNGSYVYTPVASFRGSINVQYTIADALGATSAAMLHIEVIDDSNGPANNPPIAGDDFNYTGMNSQTSGTFYTNDGDVNGDSVRLYGITIVPTGPRNPIGVPVTTVNGGSIQYYTDGTYIYTPPPNYTGPDYINYTICDVSAAAPNTLCASAQIHFLIGPQFVTLPVTAITASANLLGAQKALVKWETQNESNSAYFEVERSIDNINFNSTGSRVTAAGNSSVPKQYQLENNIESLSQHAVIYYRVKLTGVDGQIKYSNVVQVRTGKTEEIVAWPNPFTSSITMKIVANQNTTFAIRLNDMAGRTVRTYYQPARRGISQIILTELENLANGIYFIDVIDSGSGNRTVFKFMKER